MILLFALSACFFLSLLSGCRHGDDNPPGPESGNAAIYYLEAFELLDLSEPIDVSNSLDGDKSLDGVIRTGWPEEGTALNSFIEKNIAFFVVFRKGAALEYCRFERDATGASASGNGFPHGDDAWSALLCTALLSRYHEKNGAMEEAVHTCLALLAFSRHLYDDPSFLAKAYAAEAEERALAIVTSFAAGDSLDGEAIRTLSDGLAEHEKRRGATEKIVLDEKEAYLANIRALAEGIAVDEPPGSDGTEKTASFKEALVVQGELLADEVFACAVAAARSNREEDWFSFQTRIDRVKAESMTADTFTLFNNLTRAAEKEAVAINEEAPHRITGYLLLLSMTNYRHVINKRFASGEELAELMTTVGKGKKPLHGK